MKTDEILRELAPQGAIRTAINLGNPVLAGRDAATGELAGVSVDLAREVGRRLEVEIEFIPFDAAGKVTQAVSSGELDMMFLAVDPVRAAEILFTAPYVVIEGTYLVREDATYQAVDELDHAGARIAVGQGAAYDLFLTRHLKQASLERAATSPDAIALFVAQQLDAAAGVRQPLAAYAADHPGYRVLPGRFTAIEQGMGVPRGREIARAWLQDFVEDVKKTGLVKMLLDRHGQSAASVAPPAAGWSVF
ncbi:ABC transporter substrate-binding protein [Acetobacter sp.]|jgi:polar amino acid transport system substrate-binding protein|uniref:ABC transporter substrate-binding protein n=1 Tax=Acetobacter sp. TaxID=440 RepID=UPI0025BFF928|nr:ABC transporter substrate-binding protein [Acetobacter sp.]MCH4092417.1 ABC transporter substrate-binding protein [Acetobacter sp.]MCI1299550.1 ABC transporter substrate-binding protein [Acetobacter sp.]MCI1315570.1 ABC transporter substrate-binding protein [Acetobacter sp.]